jgi:hypothetical protein
MARYNQWCGEKANTSLLRFREVSGFRNARILASL